MLEVSEDYTSGLSKDGEQMEKKVRSAALVRHVHSKS